ncbi:MAG: LytTR family DNA-binding domain-containing protein [Bacteroidota bacterium]|nr:LytTR family DNA-binding domain-containing protein [Bacteroidota bacterium]MDP4211783.1 LytTR family DNA-binding domain-containing protein [Bacteroidota bacterium]MDP4248981.1 LytTR family DNA-binding domain-containing protein [Bacteroidota bacterium]
MLTAPLKYLVLDDDEIDRISIENEAKKFPFFQKIASCAHPLEAFELISRFQPDIIFLDIEMPDMSGIELIKTRNISHALPVLITSHPEFAIESYELDAFDYLLKPLNAERFARCAHRLHDFWEMRMKSFDVESRQESGYIIIKQGHDKYKLPIPEITYLEAMKDYTRIKTVTGQYLVLTTLSGILEKLPADLFVRIHRSYVVNREKIDVVEKSKIHIQDHILPIGKLYKNALKPFFD